MVAVLEKTYTVSEFLEMDDFEAGFLYELINGEIVRRASPSTDHQRASRNLFRQIDSFVLNNSKGECFCAPYDVQFDDYNFLQPDIIFVATENAGIIKPGCIKGAPDLLVEILSPGTHKDDRGDKMKVYRRSGVREYWIVDPRNKSIEVYTLKDSDYELTFFAMESGEIASQVLEGLTIAVEKVFEG